MFVAQVLCDFCGKPIRQRKRCREESKAVTVFGYSRTKEWNTRHLFPHLCKGCAVKLDIAFKDLKDEMAHREAIMIRNTQLNRERREELGTKG